jgi:DNA replication ATP-dependent helicase Dna2
MTTTATTASRWPYLIRVRTSCPTSGGGIWSISMPIHEGEEPDVRKALLFKGGLEDIHSDRITILLTDGQQNADIFNHLPYRRTLREDESIRKADKPFLWCVEHGSSDAGGSAAIGALYELITSTPDRKALLLGQRAPQADKSLELSRSYLPDLDAMLTRAKQARDYFLLVGPPGTGKTSMALRFMVEEALHAPSHSQSSRPTCCSWPIPTVPSTRSAACSSRLTSHSCGLAVS